MKLEDPVLRWILTDERLRGLSADQCLAVAESLLAVVAADGRRTDDELRRVRRELMRLPWRWDHKQEDADAALAAASNSSAASPTQIAGRLTEPAVREVVLRMLYAVAIADGITASEEETIERFRDAFGIAPDRAEHLRGLKH